MKRASDIKLILFEREALRSEPSRRFLAVEGPEKIIYSGEDELKGQIERAMMMNIPSKETLILKEFKGRLFQKCPASKGMVCCNYYLLNTCFDCLYGCAYCFLRSYLNSYGMVQFTNIEKIEDDILASPEYNSGKLLRVGTGEFTDSLMFDEITGLAPRLIKFASDKMNLMLEFKTKSDNIDHLLGIKGKGNTVLAWSLNLPRSIELFEPGTAGLEARLSAAERAADAGYYVAFHFDPVILGESRVEEYGALIDRIFDAIDDRRIVWFSMGGIRYTPAFKEILRYCEPDEELILQEMLPGTDGKMRYLKQRRIELYSYILNKIRSRSGYPFVYMCMESSEMWERVFGLELNDSDDLEREFIRHLNEKFMTRC